MKNLIIELQEIVAHQNQDITRLSDELYSQQKEIIEIKMQLRNILTKLEPRAESNSDAKTASEEMPPPHY